MRQVRGVQSVSTCVDSTRVGGARCAAVMTAQAAARRRGDAGGTGGTRCTRWVRGAVRCMRARRLWAARWRWWGRSAESVKSLERRGPESAKSLERPGRGGSTAAMAGLQRFVWPR